MRDAVGHRPAASELVSRRSCGPSWAPKADHSNDPGSDARAPASARFSCTVMTVMIEHEQSWSLKAPQLREPDAVCYGCSFSCRGWYSHRISIWKGELGGDSCCTAGYFMPAVLFQGCCQVPTHTSSFSLLEHAALLALLPVLWHGCTMLLLLYYCLLLVLLLRAAGYARTVEAHICRTGHQVSVSIRSPPPKLLR